jgi:decaprenylphospho-beta-D-ribofuranose 2-oxidase
MNLSSQSSMLSGWGRYPVQRCDVLRPDSAAEVPALLGQEARTVIARGMGRSYGDAALNADGTVVDASHLNRYLAFDPATGELECEAGVSLADIVEVFLPRGFFLPVTPGTKFITVGGAIASDIHGKNHHRDGSFARPVLWFDLLPASGETLRCSSSEHADLFWATCGGMGLTGIVLRARIRLQPVKSAYVRVDFRRTTSLEETMAAHDESDHQYHYSVSWLNVLAGNARLGASVMMRGNDADPTELPRNRPALRLNAGRSVAMPFSCPSFVLSPLTVRTFNSFYYFAHPTRTALVNFEQYFYPLDKIAGWNRLYGKRGFIQYQMALPPASASAGLRKSLETIRAAGLPGFLAVLKRFGEGTPGPLSFPMEGYTLAVDVPFSAEAAKVARELDAIVADHGGRVYLAKDALLEPAMLQRMYPQLDRFLEIRRSVDPQGRFVSSLARRVGLAT